jgi:hypothetical protein
MRLLEEEIFRIKTMMNLPIQKNTILESNAIFGGQEVDVNNFEVGNYYYSYYSKLFWIIKILEINGDNLTYLETAFDEDAVKYDKEPVKYTNPKWVLVGSQTPETPSTRTFWQTSEKIWDYVLTFTYVDDYNKDTDCKKCVPAENIKVGKYYIYKKDAFDEIVKIKTIDGNKITADYIEYNVLTKFDNPDEYIYDIKTFDNRWDLSDEKTWKHVMSLPIMEDVVKGSGFDTDKKKEQKRKEKKRKEENNQISDKEPEIKKDNTLDNSVGCSYDKTKGLNLGDVTEIPIDGIAKFEGSINGKEVSINGCFNKGKVILTYDEGEIGSRGNFKGHYYTNDNTEPFSFSGEPQYSNNFLAGRLDNDNQTDIEEYKDNFHTKTWTYSGYFTKEGKLGESNPEVLIPDGGPFKINKTPTILFALGDYYYGEFKESKIDGKGVYYFADNGLKLEGEFKTIDVEGGTAYSCKLNSGKDISNIFEYNERYDLEKNQKKEDQSFGVLKKGILKGTTLFNTTIKNTKTKEEKKLSGPLPYVNIKVQNKRYKNIVSEIKSDENGNFEFEDLPFGMYKILAAYDKGNGLGFVLPSQTIFKKNEVIFDTDGKRKNLILIPTKKTKIKDNKEATDNPDFLKNIDSKNYVEKRMNIEYSKYEYEKYLKNAKQEIEDYTDKQTLQFCKKETTLYAKMVRDLYNEVITKDMVKSPQNLQPTKDFLKSCYMRYKNESNFFNYKKNEDLVLLMNPGNDLYGFKIVLENKDIYRKNIDMSISNSIRKVIKEQDQIKNDSLIENQIIRNRIDFVIKHSNNRNFKNNLIEESKKLINSGYNEKFVKILVKRLLN